jgi:phosphatidylinositol-bisphosphatase
VKRKASISSSQPSAQTAAEETIDPVDPDDTDPDVYVLGIQELDLSTEALIYSLGTAREDAWCRAVFASLGEKAEKYEKVRTRSIILRVRRTFLSLTWLTGKQLTSIQLVGMLIVVIVKKKLKECFSDVKTTSAGAGILGVMVCFYCVDFSACRRI